MNYETILYDLTDGIAEIRLNRPQRLNAVTQQLYDELNDALTRAEADPDTRVVLITGEGRAFCVGADLKAHKVGRTAFDRRQYLKGEQDACHRLLHMKTPVIAAVNGYALGAGAEIAPGVPWCQGQDGAGPLALALKSGNFGDESFFTRALAAAG